MVARAYMSRTASFQELIKKYCYKLGRGVIRTQEDAGWLTAVLTSPIIVHVLLIPPYTLSTLLISNALTVLYFFLKDTIDGQCGR